MKNFLSVAALLSISASILPAQTQLGTGSITGTVIDPSGQVVANAAITVTNVDTAARREIASSSNGSFTVPVLPPGNYKLHIVKAGFSALDESGIAVAVGGAATVYAKLQIGQTTDTVTVTDNVLIDTTKTSESTLIDRKEIQDLPINGRRVDQFALLSNGVARTGTFGLLSFHGQSGNFVNYLIEGNDDNQSYFSEPRGRTRIASSVSSNAVQEFEVGRGAYAAEFGRSAGGAINTVIRSGSNGLHGDGFWYYRNQDFGARDPLASVVPPESRHQFGGSISGSLIKDKLFYFGNYDQQLRDSPILIEDLDNVLTTAKPVLPANPTAAQTTQFNTDTTAFNAGYALVLSKFPNGAPGNSQSRTFNQSLSLAKVDWILNQKNTLTFYYNDLYWHGIRAIQTSLVLPNVGRNGSDDVRVHSGNARLTTSIRPNLINEFRLQLSQDFEFEFADQPPPQTTINLGSNPFSFGQATFLQRPAYPDERRYQFVDNLSWIKGAHSFKFGGEFNRAFEGINNPASFGGQYSYANTLQLGRDLINPASHSYTSFAQNFGLPGINFATIDYALFAQDQWKISRKLTLNYGLRWDYQQLPSPLFPNLAIPETGKFNHEHTAFGPRAGAAYDLNGNGKTVLRAGYALYYARIPNGIFENALAQTGAVDPTRATIGITFQPTDVGAPNYPNIYSSLPAVAIGATSVERLASNYKRPRIQDFNFGIERQIANNLVVSASYIHSYGDHLELRYDANLPATPNFTRTYQLADGTTFQVPFVAGITKTAAGVTQSINLSRPNSGFGAINVDSSQGQSWYNAMFLELKRRYTNGVLFTVSYTLAKAENLVGSGDGTGSAADGAFGGGTPRNQYNLGSNRGIAPTDQRQRLVTSFVYEPHYKFLKRLRLSGIYVAESGRGLAEQVSVPSLPFIGPDGATYNGFGGLLGQGSGGDRNLLPTVTRNTLTSPNNFRVDLRLARDFKITERLFGEVILEGFNVLNHSNYNGTNNTQYTAAAPSAAATIATPIQLVANTSFNQPNNDGSQPDGTNARRLQVSVRFRF